MKIFVEVPYFITFYSVHEILCKEPGNEKQS